MQNKYKCAHCKKLKNRNSVVINQRKFNKAGNLVIYYWCNECNSQRLREYRKTETGRKNTNKAVYKSVKKLWFKQKARLLLNLNVRLGKLKKPIKCQKCKKVTKVEAHHKDYTKPLEVKWLCRTCHRLEHK